jgi:hypothetical protein
MLSVLLALTLCGASARGVEPDWIFLRFEVFGGPGLHFLTLQVRVQQSPERYSLTVEAETLGIAELFVDLRSKAEARGSISDGVLHPEAMRSETHRRGADFHTRIDYGANGAVVAEATPPLTGVVTPVSPAQVRGTVDHLTAYLVLARHLAARGSCTLGLAVFDGRRRYDLSFGDLPAEALPGFPDRIRVCGMRRRRIAGFPIEQGGDQPSDEGKLWFARLVPGGVMIPVRMEFGSEFGRFVATLAELRSRWVERRFTE